MSANCAICFTKFGFFRGANSCRKCAKSVCKSCIKNATCVHCINSDLEVRGFDEVPKNLYREGHAIRPRINGGHPSYAQQGNRQSRFDPADLALEQRLAQLKSAGQTETAHPGPIVRVMSISDQSQMDQETAIQKIIEQTCAEVEMDSESQDTLMKCSSSADREIEERLRNLQVDSGAIGSSISKHKWSWQVEEENRKKREEEEMAKWCCICNDDGHVKCKDCDDDVYCSRCFKEQHGRNNVEQHRTVRI